MKLKTYKVMKNFHDLKNQPHLRDAEIELSDADAEKCEKFIMLKSDWQEAHSKKVGLDPDSKMKEAKELFDKAEEALSVANKQADAIIAEAEADATKIRSTADFDAQAVLSKAEKEAKELLEKAKSTSEDSSKSEAKK
jgi:hypothetical protein